MTLFDYCYRFVIIIFIIFIVTMIISFLTVDYSKVPRSSGDGMEYSSSNSSDGSISKGSDDSELPQRNITSLPTTTKSQMFGDKAAYSSTGRKTMPQPKNYQEKQRNTNTQDILNHQIKSGHGVLTNICL